MRKLLPILVLCMFLLVSIVSASQNVDVVVVGMISHGPMQPTVNAIKEVTSKYPDVNVKWYDLQTSDGESYAQEHGLTAHLNVLINGKYQYDVNGKTVTFRYFNSIQSLKT